MLEVTIWSLLIGNLGWQALVVSKWLLWHQVVASHQHREEEESLTRFESKEDFTPVELPQRNGKVASPSHDGRVSRETQFGGWEYKIVRANRDLFRIPSVFQQLCKEEAISGWIMLEKLDDRRVRFKRLISLRDVLDTQQLPHDPYRCHYGSSAPPIPLVGAIAVLIAIVVPSVFGYTLVSRMLKSSKMNSPMLPSEYEHIPPQTFPPKNLKQ